MLVSLVLISVIVSCLSVFLSLSVALRVKKTLDPLIEEGVFRQGAVSDVPDTVAVGTPVPAVGELLDHQGRGVTLPSSHDGPWILTFQSTDCSGCKSQLPVYRAYLERYGLPRERVLSVVSGTREDLDLYTEALGESATIVHADDAGELADSLGVQVWPTYLIVSPDGTVGHSGASASSLPTLDLTVPLDGVTA
ncbi:redoxin domain-containing protein [Streptomyces sp. NPDC046853]|uniref:TlpA family protein disulfide reductase n=1 Tax=Streptomyces sp. NPDC046853 TaxID=3154920 RepID=UPI0033FB8C7A